MSVPAEQVTPVIDRHASIEANIDPEGRKWVIHASPRRALYSLRPEPYRQDFRCPATCKGYWTKASLLQEALTQHLTNMWDKAEAVDKKLERKRAAAREANKKAKCSKAAPKTISG